MDVETPSRIDFGQILSENYKNLTKSEKQIADYLRKNQDESAFLSAGLFFCPPKAEFTAECSRN